MLRSKIILSSELSSKTLRAEDYVVDAKRARLLRAFGASLKAIQAQTRRMENCLKELEKIDA